MKPISPKLLSAALIFLTATLSACAGGPSSPERRPVSTPFTGDLSVFEYAGRAENLQVERVMDLLGLAPGRSVADIGAGSGWFAVRAARRVAPGGTVYAVDIYPPFVTHLADRAAREGLANMLAALGSGYAAGLPLASVDAVLFLNAYHEVAKPVDLLRTLQP